MVDRFSRWIEDVRMRDMTAISIIRVFFDNLVARSGPQSYLNFQPRFDPIRVTVIPDSIAAYRYIRTKRICTGASYPASNCIIKHKHRNIKAALATA